jgi:hypothetical protein
MTFTPMVFAAIIADGQRDGKVLGGIRVDEGIERLIGGWPDHNLAAQAVAVVDDDLLLRTRLHGISLLQDLRHGSLHHRCIRLQPRRIHVRTGNSKHPAGVGRPCEVRELRILAEVPRSWPQQMRMHRATPRSE